MARYEEGIANKFDLFLSEEEFEELLIHYFNEHDYDRTLQVADVAISQHSFTPEFYKWKALIHKINLEQLTNSFPHFFDDSLQQIIISDLNPPKNRGFPC